MTKAKLLFQIGFNKCATSALFKLFQTSGVKSVHSNGRFWRSLGHEALLKKNLQIEIDRNVREGRPAIQGFEDFEAFFDMEYERDEIRIENFRHFAAFARDYPQALFVLNTRDKRDWLQSRLRHNDGKYLMRAKARLGTDRAGVLQHWSDEFDRHHEAVLDFFRAESDRLLVFDVDWTPVEDLIAFARPYWALRRRYWKKIRVTDEMVEKLGWRDRNQSVDPELEIRIRNETSCDS